MILIDELIYRTNLDIAPVDEEDTSKFYIVRPFSFYYGVKVRLMDAIQVLKGNAVALNFKQDELLNKKKKRNEYKG